MILAAHDLVKRFGAVEALRGISLDISPGEIFGLVGPDGAGKTTTLRLLVGVMDPDAGEVRIDDLDVAREAARVRERVGYMPQHFALYGDLSVEENLLFFADMYFVPRAERDARLAELYAFSRLDPFRDRPASKLSGGMQKKLALSCAMIHAPRVLLLDEPTTGVDPISRRELWEILYRFADRGVAMVISTPYMDEAERCHRVGLMHEGTFLAVDTPRAIIEGHGEPVFAVAGSAQEAARAALHDAAGVIDAYPFGDMLHVALRAGESGEAIERTLSAANVEFASVQRVRPSFEDVFMARVRGQA